MRDVRRGRHNVDQLVACVLGVAGHKAQDKIALDLVKLGKQIGKIVVLALGVGVDVLPKQRNILVALCHQLANLGNDLLLISAALSAAHIGHDAIGAEIVAAVHNGHPRAVVAASRDGHALGYDVLGLLRAENATGARDLLPEQLGKTVQGCRAEGQVHVRILVLDILAAVLLRHHTAADRNDQRGLFGFEVLILPHDGKCLLLGVLANGAGVDRDQIGICGVGAKLVAHVLRHTRKLFAVRLVLLAAKGQHKAPGRMPQSLCKLSRKAAQLFYILLCVLVILLVHSSVYPQYYSISIYYYTTQKHPLSRIL